MQYDNQVCSVTLVFKVKILVDTDISLCSAVQVTEHTAQAPSLH